MKQIRENLGLNLIIAIAASILFGAFIPLSTYISNSQEFTFVTKWDMLKISGLVSIVLFVIFLILLSLASLVHKKVYGYTALFLSGLALAVYTEGNIILANYPILDGKDIPWEKMVGVGISNSVVWLLIIVFALFSYWKWKEECFGILKTVMLAFSGLMILFGGLRFAALKPAPVSTVYFNMDKFYEVSSERNVIVFVVDTFDQLLFDELLQKDPEVKHMLKDFTYYSNTIGKFSTTKGALPHIITGIPNDNKYSYFEYLNKSFSESNFLKQLQKEKYKAHFYIGSVFTPSESVLNDFDCIENYSKADAGKTFKISYKSVYWHSLFTYTPHFFKKAFAYKSSQKATKKTDEAQLSKVHSVTAMLENSNDGITLKKGDSKGLFKLYHLYGVIHRILT